MKLKKINQPTNSPDQLKATKVNAMGMHSLTPLNWKDKNLMMIMPMKDWLQLVSSFLTITNRFCTNLKMETAQSEMFITVQSYEKVTS